MLPASIPSPAQGVWHLGPLPLRAYALFIIVGILVAVWLAERRWTARGGRSGFIADIAMWVVPFGVIGGRLYHVATDPELYFAAGRNPWAALYIWNGGLGIWGAIGLGAVGAFIGARRAGASFRDLADVVAPSLALAQAIGRLGNWFNQELFGRPTDLPWGLSISPENRPAGFEQFLTFHPTFLYELLWNLALVGVLLWAERRFQLRGGRLFAVYVMGYTAGRAWIEHLRIDPANHILGLRLNEWTSVLVFLTAAVFFFATRRPSARAPGPEIEGDGFPPRHLSTPAAHRVAFTDPRDPDPPAGTDP